MTKLTSTPAGAVLVAIDMSKNRQEVLIERPEGGRRRRMTVMATRQDYDGFAEQLAAIGRPIIVGFEATGNYHRTLAHRLLTAGFELRLISSVALARTREALHNGWDKNDPKDAQVILHMLRIGATQRYVDPLVAGINDLQELSKTHETISRMKTQTWHRILTHYLPLYFPEIARFAGNSRSDWFLALIERFPTPASITALDAGAFSAAAWPLIGRKVSKARLVNDIYETACASVALPVPEDSAAITMFRMVIAQGRSLIHQRDEIERLAHARLADDVDYQLLRNIPGIGPINALTILAEASTPELGARLTARRIVALLHRCGRRNDNALVQQILAFGRRQPSEQKVVPLRPLIEEMARLLRATLPAGVELQLALDPAAPPVLVPGP